MGGSSDTERNPLTIDPVTGSVWTAQTFDYETTRGYRYVVTATDHGSPPRTGSAELWVDVIDEPDDTIRFSKAVWLLFDSVCVSDQLHGAKTRAKTHAKTHAETREKTHTEFFVASNCDKTSKRRHWLLSQFAANVFVVKIV